MFENPEASIISLPGLPPEPEPLTDWYESQEVQQKLASFIEDHLNQSWQDRVENLQDMSSSTAIMWCPLPQYGQVKNGGKLTMVDMGHGESSMSLAVAAAAGRYGNIPNHPNIIHAPAIELSKSLMQKHGWAKRVLFSEDQGKAMAAAIVMGFELHQTRRKHQNVMQGHPRVKLTVLMQKESDNVRVIDNILWLKNRQHSTSAMNHNDTPGFLALEAPTLGFKDGVLQVSCSSFVQGKTLESIVQAMDVDRRLETTDLYKQYLDEITKVWNEYEGTPVRLDGDEKSSSPKRQIIASCVVEPILTSAVCGMTFVDPLWQRALVDVARSKNVPVIFDESASGMYRIGVASCREILKVDPDVAIHSTGGVLPMSVALATEEVYEAYSRNNSGEEYGDYFSLNNGAAPPMACVGAIHALESYDDASLFLFNEEQTRALSKLPLVQQSCSLGSVLALTINGNNAVSIAQELAINEGLHVRAIGDTITILASPLANADECARICDMLHHTIKQFGRENENVSL